MDERERGVGWSTLALLLFFVGFGIACFGIAPLVSGEGGVRHIVLALVGFALFLGSGVAYVPLLGRDLARDDARFNERVLERGSTPLGPGSSIQTGHLWHMHAIRLVTPVIIWLMSIPALTSPEGGLLKWGWLALPLLITYAAWMVQYALALSVTHEGVILKRLTGAHELKYRDIRAVSTASMRGGMPSTLVVSTSSNPLAPKLLIPLFDERLRTVIEDHVPIRSGHT